MAARRAAEPRAASDPARPVYHFRPPAGWLNDPNGTIYHSGWYHLFYQHNPFGDRWGSIHWGHARSGDLVHWEHLPIALGPDPEREDHCFSGCAFAPAGEQPLLFYTSFRDDYHSSPAEQCAVHTSDDLTRFFRSRANPVLSLDGFDGPRFRGDWRDPFVFREGGRVFMILGARLADADISAIALFETSGDNFLDWRYRGLLHEAPCEEVEYFECPSLLRFGDRHVLVYSPERQVEYAVGSLDLERYRFEPTRVGRVDHSLNYYAAAPFVGIPGDRQVLLGWIRGWGGGEEAGDSPGIREYRSGRGWNGVLSLPRELSLDRDGSLRQHPVPELEELRAEPFAVRERRVNDETLVLGESLGAELEVRASFGSSDCRAWGLRLRPHGDSAEVEIRFSEGGRRLAVAGTELYSDPVAGGTDVHAFYDRSTLEVFLNAGRAACTRVLDTEGSRVGIEVFAEGGSIIVTSLDAWELESIW